MAVTPALRALIEHKKYKSPDNTISHISVPNGAIYFAGANSGDLSSRAIRIVLCDEIDKYPLSAGVEGSPLKLAEERASTYKSGGRAKFVRVCSPTVEGQSLIGHEYAASDQRQCFLACPHCGFRQTLRWENPEGGNFGHVEWQKDDQGHDLPQTACIVCCECGTAWSEADRIKALDELEHADGYGWRQTKPFTCCGIEQTPKKWDANGRSVCSECGQRSPYAGHAGFHLSKLYSKRHRLSDIVEELLAAEGSPEAKRKWRNTALAELWKPEYEEVFSSSKLMARREPYGPHNLPPTVKVITCGCDTQRDRIEVQIIGWADSEEAFVVMYLVLYGDPGQPQIWHELDAVRNMEFKVRGREGVMKITALAIDAGGSNTQDVLKYANARRGHVFACRGAPGGPHLHIWPGKYSKSKVTGRKDRFWSIGVDAAKEELFGRLALEPPPAGEPKPGFIHFPMAKEIGAEYFAQLSAERPILHKRIGGFKVVWTKVRPRNEALDTFVLALAVRKAIRRDIKHPPMYKPNPNPVQLPIAVKEQAMATDPVISTVDELLKAIDTMDDAQCLQAVETLLQNNPALANNEAMQAFLKELEAAGAVINLPPPLPANINPATVDPGLKMRDWSGRPVDKDGNVIGGPGPRVIAPAPDDVVPEQPPPKPFGSNWGNKGYG